MTKTRIDYLDFIKFFAIYFVVWGHATQYAITDARESVFYHPVGLFIVSFHMPLFMTLSGLFSASALKTGFWSMVKKKFVQLILPAWFWTLVNMGLLLVRGKNPLEVAHWSMWVFSNYWFLTCLLLCYIIFWLSIKAFRKDWLAAILTILITMVMPYGSFVYLNFMLPFFWFGYFIKKYALEKPERFFSWKTAIIPILLYIFFFLGMRGNYSVYQSPTVLFNSNYTVFNVENFYITFYRLVTGLLGSYVIMFFLKKLYDVWQGSTAERYFTKWGKETFGIYMIHNMLFVPMSWVYTFPQTVNPYLFDFLYVHAYAWIAIAISLGMIYTAKRWKLTSWTMGAR